MKIDIIEVPAHRIVSSTKKRGITTRVMCSFGKLTRHLHLTRDGLYQTSCGNLVRFV